MEKTVIQWLNELPEPLRTMAIRNTGSNEQHIFAPSMLHAIKYGPAWVGSPEGIEFWQELCGKIERGEDYRMTFDDVIWVYTLRINHYKTETERYRGLLFAERYSKTFDTPIDKVWRAIKYIFLFKWL